MRFRERLRVPAYWWLLAAGFAGSLAVAFGYYLGWGWGTGSGLVALLVAAALFRRAALTVAVGPDHLSVGRAEIDHRYIGAVRPLAAAQTRLRSGPQADARAHLVLRPYVATAVEITLADPADPVPYWLVSSRRPAALAAALESARHDQPVEPA